MQKLSVVYWTPYFTEIKMWHKSIFCKLSQNLSRLTLCNHCIISDLLSTLFLRFWFFLFLETHHSISEWYPAIRHVCLHSNGLLCSATNKSLPSVAPCQGTCTNLKIDIHWPIRTELQDTKKSFGYGCRWTYDNFANNKFNN